MRTTITALLLAAALPAWAQPAPGLWETDWKMRVNGQDLGALMKRAMDEALQGMPPAQRAQAEQMMKAQGAGFGGKSQDCVTPEASARMADPKQLLAEMQKDSPQCRYEPLKTSGGTIAFEGRCSDPEGFTGDITGEFRLDGAKAWTGQWGGQGRMPAAEGMPGLTLGADGRVEFRATGSGRWLAAACGAVKPR
ncbi:MAG: hypothetical protein Fur0014_09480 [Rubrivivax sp.]